MKCLVTGGAGFIGYHLIQELERKKHDVVSIDNFFHSCLAPSKSIYTDVRNYAEVDNLISSVDVVFHLAAQIHVDYSIKYPAETFDINLRGTLNVLEACKNHNKKLIFASTSEVYGSSKTDFMSESHPTDPQSPYGASKLSADALCRAYHATYGAKVIVLRNFNTFGAWQNDTSYGSVIAKFTRAALLGENLTIYGDGKQQRDYMHVKDAVSMYLHCMNIEEYGTVVNAGTGKTICINDLAEMICKITNSKSQIVHTYARSGEVQRLCADTTKAKSLGFISKTDFEKDMADYIHFYEKEILKR